MARPKAHRHALAIIFLLLMGAAQGASASDWVEIGDDMEGSVYFVDLDSVQAKSYSSIVSVWTQIVDPDNSSIKDLLEFDFSDRTWRGLARYRYDSNNRVTESYTTAGEWNYIIPDSIAEEVYLFLKDVLGN